MGTTAKDSEQSMTNATSVPPFQGALVAVGPSSCLFVGGKPIRNADSFHQLFGPSRPQSVIDRVGGMIDPLILFNSQRSLEISVSV